MSVISAWLVAPGATSHAEITPLHRVVDLDLVHRMASDAVDAGGDILADRDAQLDHRDAVAEYTAAFDVAESEAIRRRRSDFSAEDQERLARAQHLLRLASDGAATPQERENAYGRAQRELAGLIVLPAVTRAAIENRVIGEIEA